MGKRERQRANLRVRGERNGEGGMKAMDGEKAMLVRRNGRQVVRIGIVDGKSIRRERVLSEYIRLRG